MVLQQKLAAGTSVRSKLAGKLPTTTRRPLLTDTGRGTRRPHCREKSILLLCPPAEARALEDLGGAAGLGNWGRTQLQPRPS